MDTDLTPTADSKVFVIRIGFNNQESCEFRNPIDYKFENGFGCVSVKDKRFGTIKTYIWPSHRINQITCSWE